MTTKQLTVVAHLFVKPGTEQGFLERFGDLVAQSRAEPGCINYDFHQHPTEPHRFIFYENYVDQAAFDLHLTQPHTQRWVDYANAHDAHFDIEFWTMLSQPGSDAKVNPLQITSPALIQPSETEGGVFR